MKGTLLIVVVGACSSSGMPPVGDDDIQPDGNPGGDAGGSLIDPAWPDDMPLPPEFDFPPYANLVDGTAVAISWRTVGISTGVVRFGTTEELGSEVIASDSGNLHHVMLTDLVPSSAYFYEVALDNTTVTRRGVFVMPGRPDWRFMHSGEFHAPSESTNVAKFAGAIREFRPHVILESGDMVDDGNNLAHWRSYMRTSAPWISNVLLIPAHSNHVNGDGGNTLLKDIFVLPDNERWFTTRYGQVEFFSIDSTFSANDDIETAEVPWLATAAAAAHDGTDDPLITIAAWHHPACSSQYFTRTGERNWVQDNLVATFKDNGGVDLILAAHDKYYERSMITGGIVHLITNIGNVSPEIPGGNYADCTAMKTDRSTQSTAFFTVAGGHIDAKIVDESGSEFDAFSIDK